MNDLGKGFIIFSLIILVGCIGSPNAPKIEADLAKKFVADPNNSVIYIYRSTMVAAIQSFRLSIDNELLGDSKNESFFRKILPAGNHTIIASTISDKSNRDILAIETTNGNIYYVELQLGANPVSGIPKLRISNEQEAQKTILRCSLLKAGTSAMDK